MFRPRSLYIYAFVAALAAAPAHAEDGGKTYNVSPGMSIQSFIDKANPGDVVQVLPGDYVESLTLAKDGVTLRGMEYEGQRAVMRGRGEGEEEQEPLARAVMITGDGVTVEGLVIDDYGEAGLVAKDCADLTIRDVLVQRSGRYGVRLNTIHGATLDNVVAGGASASAIALADSLQIALRRSEGYRSAAGLTVQNSQETMIDNCSFHHNAAGIAIVSTVPEVEQRASYTKILHSRVMGNNRATDAPEGTLAARLPAGFGIVLWGADHTEIVRSVIADNGAMGIATLAYQDGLLRHQDKDAERPGPVAQETYVHHNLYEGNGAAPSKAFTERFPEIPPGDLYWDGLGERNQFQEHVGLKTYPERLVVEQGGVHTDVVHFL